MYNSDYKVLSRDTQAERTLKVVESTTNNKILRRK